MFMSLLLTKCNASDDKAEAMNTYKSLLRLRFSLLIINLVDLYIHEKRPQTTPNLIILLTSLKTE